MSVLSARFEFAPSRLAAALIAAGAAMAVAATLIIPIPLPLRLLAAAAVAALFFAAARRQAWLSGGKAVCGLEFRQRGKVIVLDKNGNHADLGEISYCFVSPLFCTAVISGSNRRYQALIMPDSLPPEDYRHLRIQLNTQGSH